MVLTHFIVSALGQTTDPHGGRSSRP